MIKNLFYLVFIALSLIFSGCVNDRNNSAQNPAYQVKNYTFTGNEHIVSFSGTPKKLLVCGNSGLETIIALGGADRVAAAVLTDAADKEKFAQQLPKAQLYTQALQLESAMALQPDFIVAWRRFFADNQLGDTPSWQSRGIPAYIQDASGPIPAKGRFPACTIASEKNFIKNMGIALDKQQEADNFILQIDHELQQGVSKMPAKVLFVEFLGNTIEVFGNDLLSGDIIKHYGSTLVAYSAPFISQEELMNMDADIIFVVYHGDTVVREAAVVKFNDPLYAHLRAVQQKKIYPIAYKEIVAPGVNLVHTLQYIRRCLDK